MAKSYRIEEEFDALKHCSVTRVTLYNEMQKREWNQLIEDVIEQVLCDKKEWVMDLTRIKTARIETPVQVMVLKNIIENRSGRLLILAAADSSLQRLLSQTLLDDLLQAQ